jgi:hypothetical protein
MQKPAAEKRAQKVPLFLDLKQEGETLCHVRRLVEKAGVT